MKQIFTITILFFGLQSCGTSNSEVASEATIDSTITVTTDTLLLDSTVSASYDTTAVDTAASAI